VSQTKKGRNASAPGKKKEGSERMKSREGSKGEGYLTYPSHGGGTRFIKQGSGKEAKGKLGGSRDSQTEKAKKNRN